VLNVTPILRDDAQTAYQNSFKIVQNEAVYCCTDVTNITNSGFSIINTDKEMAFYKKYSWSASGYSVVA